MYGRQKIELLAPGGDIDSIKAAIVAGADAVYCGLERFNARNRATNISFDNLNGIIKLAHQHNCEIFLTLNIIIVESELSSLIKTLNRLVNTEVDGVIVQDLGLLYLLRKFYPSLKVHASTQLTTHNSGQIEFLAKIGATRVNLSRELNLVEIEDLTTVAHNNSLLTEVFVHGSNCISFSGLCYMSSLHGGKSGNRGRCSQPCRDQYETTEEGSDFPLNIKDNSALADFSALASAKVDSLKIEGRIKGAHYVYTVVDSWRRELDSYYQSQPLRGDDSELRTVFNRDLSNSFLQGEIGKQSFIDNPRDNSALHRVKFSREVNYDLDSAKRELYEIKSEMTSSLQEKIESLTVESDPPKQSCRVEMRDLNSLLSEERAVSPTLSLLISDLDELDLDSNDNAGVTIYFQLPSSIKQRRSELLEMFRNNRSLTPWFPAIIIGDDYQTAVEFIQELRPKTIVSNNTGVALAAQKEGVEWIAGPELNLVNSFSLLALKDLFSCSGAFISNEISSMQMRRIRSPENFTLHYSISHPITLMTTRACMFHPVTGCEKSVVDDRCISHCEKRSSIKNMKEISFYIEKARGGYHNIYNEHNFLNSEIMRDLPEMFSSFMVDLRDIKTATKVMLDKGELVTLFNNYLSGEVAAMDKIKVGMQPTTYSQYSKGI